MVKEIWRTIPGYEKYQVSNLGQIRRKSGGITNAKTKHILAPGYLTGYPRVTLRVGNRSVGFNAHVAVALAFKGPRPSPNHEVAHWDGDRRNCCAKNLRWATHAENGQDMRRHGRAGIGSKNRSAKLTESKVLKIRKQRAKGLTLRELGEKFSVHLSTIHLICTREHWRHI